VNTGYPEETQRVLMKAGESTSPLFFTCHSHFAAIDRASGDIFVTAWPRHLAKCSHFNPGVNPPVDESASVKTHGRK